MDKCLVRNHLVPRSPTESMPTISPKKRDEEEEEEVQFRSPTVYEDANEEILDLDDDDDYVQVDHVHFEGSVMNHHSNSREIDSIESSLFRLLHDLDNGKHHASSHNKHKRRQKVLALLEQLKSLKEEEDAKDFQIDSEELCNCKKDCDLSSECGKENDNALQSDEKNDLKKSSNDEDNIIEEIRKVKRQNKITHIILGVIIVSSVIWHFGELSVALLIKNHVTHPFRSFGRFMGLKMRGPDSPHHNHNHKDNPSLLPHIDTSGIPHFESPQMPQVDIPHLFHTEEIKHSSGSKILEKMTNGE